MHAEALQQHDDWDATPLYYAAYAGNKDLVKYLLSVGAKCEEKVLLPLSCSRVLEEETNTSDPQTSTPKPCTVACGLLLSSSNGI